MTTLHTFTVEGWSNRGFPLDMLRYDTCWPKRQVDGGAITALLAGQSDRGRSERCRIELTGLVDPTFHRWESFGWTVSGRRSLPT